MNTASLANSKRLYELSGWYDSDRGNHGVPAYDSGFLLRQLPKILKTEPEVDNAFLGLSAVSSTYWLASYETVKDVTFPEECYGYSEEDADALALLAIKLFESGVLKK